MDKKLFLRRGGKLLCLLLSVLLLSSLLNTLCLVYDNNKTTLAGFYAEPRDSMDVVLLGASETFAGFSSSYAYTLYGFTSYPYALDATTSAVYESQVREILKRQNPKWIVVEINGLLYDDPEFHTDEGALRRYLDNIPFSWNKVKTILDTVSREDWLSYLFPLAKYHGNWKSMLDQLGRVKSIATLYLRGGTLLKGNVTNGWTMQPREQKAIAGNYDTEPLEPVSEGHLLSFLQFCRENGLENVLFVRFPHAVCDDWSYGRFRRCNEAERIIRENGFDFINMERDYEGIGLDFSRDFYNEDHLNLYGQKKLTAYFGGILAERYLDAPGVLTGKRKENWDAAAEYYQLFYDYYDARTSAGIIDTYWETCDLIAELDRSKQNTD